MLFLFYINLFLFFQTHIHTLGHFNFHTCTHLYVSCLCHYPKVPFDVRNTGSKFRHFILVAISISEVNKLPHLKLMRSCHTEGSMEPPSLHSPSVLSSAARHNRPSRCLSCWGQMGGFSLRQDVRGCSKLSVFLFSAFFFFPPFFFFSKGKSVSGPGEITYRCSGD